MHYSTKTYGHELGLSACFRQWRAQSHCRYLHGYALAVSLKFGAVGGLDANNWAVDFGSLKPVKEFLQDLFDHKLLVAGDDPYLEELLRLRHHGLAQVQVVRAVGCEAFAQLIYEWVECWAAGQYGDRVQLVSVEVREHAGNSAIYSGDQ